MAWHGTPVEVTVQPIAMPTGRARPGPATPWHGMAHRGVHGTDPPTGWAEVYPGPALL